jgi:hypothetical protein
MVHEADLAERVSTNQVAPRGLHGQHAQSAPSQTRLNPILNLCFDVQLVKSI